MMQVCAGCDTHRTRRHCPMRGMWQGVLGCWLAHTGDIIPQRTNAGAGIIGMLLSNSRHSPVCRTAGFLQPHSSRSMQVVVGAFNTQAYDAERLQLDAQARDAMIAKASVEQATESSLPGAKQGAWKWAFRKRVWDYMEENDIAKFPRPVHHRIPNFVNAEQAAQQLAMLPEFKQAQTVKVNPDTPQKQVRYLVLTSGKTLLTPQPRLRTGFFSTLSMSDFPKHKLGEACTSAGVAQFGKPVGLDTRLKVDLIVVGSSVVDKNGCRLGKGEGFAELEYGVLRWMGAIDENTPVVTTVHDCQVLPEIDTIDPDLMCPWDVPVDIIVTPTQVIHVDKTNSKLKKPPGILWDKLSPQKLSQIRILQELKAKIEEETGTKLPCGPDEKLPPLAARNNQNGSSGRGGRRGGGRGQGGRAGAGRESAGGRSGGSNVQEGSERG